MITTQFVHYIDYFITNLHTANLSYGYLRASKILENLEELHSDESSITH